MFNDYGYEWHIRISFSLLENGEYFTLKSICDDLLLTILL